jgi:hypothetical protein
VVVSCPLSVVSCPLSVVRCQLPAVRGQFPEAPHQSPGASDHSPLTARGTRTRAVARSCPPRSSLVQKPFFARHFSANLRHLFWERGKNSGKTSETSIKNVGNCRFSAGQSAISTSAYTTGTRAQTVGMLGLSSASPAATSDLLTDNSKTDRHFFGRDCDRRVSDRRDMRVAPGDLSWGQTGNAVCGYRDVLAMEDPLRPSTSIGTIGAIDAIGAMPPRAEIHCA